MTQFGISSNGAQNGAQPLAHAHNRQNGTSPTNGNHERQQDSPLWICFHPDEYRLCNLLVHSGKPQPVFDLLRPRDFANETAARIFEAALSVHTDEKALTPESVATECEKRGGESASQNDLEAWMHCAQIVLDELGELPRDHPNQATPSDEAAKLAKKLVAKRGKRAKATDPTLDEIKATSEAVNEQIGQPTFADVPASQIPPPALQIGEKPAYDEFQLRQLLYPSLQCVSLQTEAAHAERAAHYIGEDILFCP